MLAGLVAELLPEPGPAAQSAGEAWGRYLAERPAPGQRVDAAEGLRRLSSVLTEVGFEPDPVDGSDRPVIPLRHCPFRGGGAASPGRVLASPGLMRGVLAESRAPLVAERLDPFVDASLCLAHLAPTSAKRRPNGPR
jgi:predicted ArsR family transcriptional regulator